MTDTLSVYRNVEHNLNQLVGGFASNVIYSDPSNHICRICGGPKSPNYDLRLQCNRNHARAKNLGSLQLLPYPIRAMVYAPEYSGRKIASQMTKYMYDYKASSTNTEAINVLKYMLMHALIVHRKCLVKLCGGRDVTAWATVPSTQGAPRDNQRHPLNALVYPYMAGIPEIKLVPTGSKARRLSLDTFALAEEYNQSLLQHVLLIDDSWVTGGTVLSAAAAIKQRKALTVTAFCIARIINLDFCHQICPDTELFTSARYEQSYCPWLGKPHSLQECL